MGNKQLKTEDSMVLDQLLYDTFRNTELEFPIKEVTKMKLRYKDSTCYFNNHFDYFIFFNNYVFHEGLNVLYDNFITKVEKFSKNKSSIFRFLIDFDDETEALNEGYEMEFDPLFTIVFEKLEIDSVAYFSLINCNQEYLSQFFSQFYECIYVFKNNKKFEPLYFLLPNTDYLLKSECAVVYLANVSNYKLEELSASYSHQMEFSTKYNSVIFNSLYFSQFVRINSLVPSRSNELFFSFIQKNCAYYAFLKSVLYIDFSRELSEFLSSCDRLLLVVNLLINATTYNQFIFSTQKGLDIASSQNMEILIKKMMSNQEKSIQKQSYQHIKLLTINKQGSKEEGTEKEWKLGRIEQLIRTLICDSYAYGSKDPSKLRKVVVDYTEVYFNEEVDNNQITLNESVENALRKNKKVYRYENETLSFTWFLTKEHIMRLKKHFAVIAKKRLRGKNSAEMINSIFSYWFTDNYYLSNRSRSGDTMKQAQFEKKFYS